MDEADERAKRFTWAAGDIKAELPQCTDCVKNQGATECQAYVTKPDKYLLNEMPCPEKAK